MLIYLEFYVNINFRYSINNQVNEELNRQTDPFFKTIGECSLEFKVMNT